MGKLLPLIGFVCLLSMNAFAVGSPFSSVASGNWNDGATWGNTSPGVASIDYPVGGQSATISSSTTVTVPAGTFGVGSLTLLNFPNAILNVVGTLEVDGVITFAGVNRPFLNVSGILRMKDGSSVSPAGTALARFNINNGGVYEMNYSTAGVVPRATFNAGSILRFTGYTSASAAPPTFDAGVVLRNVEWSCPNQGNDITLNGTIPNINGYFAVTDTGPLPWYLILTRTANAALTVAGNFTISNGAYVILTDGTGSFDLTVNGSVTVSGIQSIPPNGGSELDLRAGSGVGTLYPKGDLTVSLGGIIDNFGSGPANIIFDGAAIHNFSNAGGSLNNEINFTVASPSTLNLGTSPLTGSGKFTLSSGATVNVGSSHAAGAIQLAPASGGNIQVTGLRDYQSNSTIVYNGVAKQTIGDGQPTGSGITTIVRNASNVALSASIVIVGTLFLEQGDLEIGANTLTLSGTFDPAHFDPIYNPSSSSNFLNATTSSNITITGTGAFGTLALSGSTTISSFILNRTSSGTVSLGSDLAIKTAGTFTHTAGTLFLNGHILTISGDFTQTGGTIIGDAAASLIINGGGTLPASISLSGAAFNTLTIARTTPTVAVSPNITLTNLNLNDGTLSNSGSITMANGGLVTVVAGTMTGNALTGSSYNVTYANTGALATGSELPTSTTALNNLTKTAGGTLTLSNPITVNGLFTLSGAFNSNAQAIDVKGNVVFNVNPTFTASVVTFSGTTALSGSALPVFGAVTVTGTGSLTPGINYQINGNLINNGTLNNAGITTTFGGTTSISGSSTSSFNNISITGTLNGPSTFNVGGNWANSGTFNGGSGTVVFNGTTSISGSSTTNFNSITISGTVNAPTTMNIGANFTNNGIFNRGTGTIVFNGSSTQSIAGSAVTDFNNITVSNPINSPAVQVQSNQNLRGVLTLSGTSTIFDADGSANTSIFKVMSSSDNPTVDASIAALPTGTSVTGNVTVQRYISIEGNNSGRVYRYISSPVKRAPVSQIQNFIPVTGPFTGSSACSGCTTTQSMFAYDETVITDTNGSGIADFNDGYTNFPVGSNADTLKVGVGYTLFVRGNVGPVSTNGSALVEFTGTVNRGNTTPVTLPVSFTTSGTLANDGWNLVGNPFPATIDWQGSGWTKTNVNDATYMLDNGLATPTYATFIGGTGANGGSRYIAAGQAFFVKAGSVSPVLTATEAVKVGGTQTTYFRTQSTINDVLRIALKQGNSSDETVIRFVSGATGNFDSNLDAGKLNNPGTMFNLTSLGDDAKPYTINAFPLLAKQDRTVKLGVNQVTPGRFTLDFSGTDTFSDNNVKIFLHDIYKDTYTDIRTTSSYEFEVKADAASFGNARFEIVFGVEVITGLENAAAHITIYPNPTSGILSVEVASDNEVSAQVINIMGSTLMEQPLNGGSVKKGTFNLQEYAEGLYILIVKDGANVYQTRIIKKR